MINEAQLNEFIKAINTYSGIDLNDKKTTLNIKLPKFISEKGFENMDDFLAKIKINQALRQETLDLVTISETYFFRELAQLKDIIFHIKSLDRRVNILSAPCASGEEVYSLAILAAHHFVTNLHIVGIDINSNVIKKAKKASYKGRTLQHLSASEKKRFFSEENGSFHINKKELCRCDFELCNVFDSRFEKLGKFDVILSRNMIIYFDYDSKLKLLENFAKLLNKDGRLYVGSADLVPDNVFFKKVFDPRGSFYQKIE